jgi:integrase/recombinase XerC
MTELGDVDVLLRALDLLGVDLAPSSRQRALSTMRGFCSWLVRRDHLASNPGDAPELTVGRPSSG